MTPPMDDAQQLDAEETRARVLARCRQQSKEVTATIFDQPTSSVFVMVHRIGSVELAEPIVLRFGWRQFAKVVLEWIKQTVLLVPVASDQLPTDIRKAPGAPPT